MTWKTYTIKEETAESLKAYLKVRFQLSSRDIQQLFRRKRIKINGRIAHSKRIPKKGDTLTIQLSFDRDYGVKPEKGSLHILYEDKHTLIINKPPFMLVHPTGQTPTGTISNLVAAHYEKRGVVYRVRPLHRLDRDTSGCILFAKTKAAHQHYEEHQRKGRLYRVYHALVEGSIPPEGTIEAPIAIDESAPNRRIVAKDGKKALTVYKRLTLQEAQSLVEVRIPTGRTHQIRVHLAHVGHPVIGDAMYGHRRTPYTRQCLHACALHFIPFEDEKVLTVSAPLDDNFGKEKKL